jgi:hypothetical protein
VVPVYQNIYCFICNLQEELGGPVADLEHRPVVDSEDSDRSEADDFTSSISSSSEDSDEVSSEEEESEVVPLPPDAQDTSFLDDSVHHEDQSN